MSPFIYLLFIIGINMFFKSIGDKKKIEEARKKKMQELKKQENMKASKKPTDKRAQEVRRDPSIFKKREEKKFHGEGVSYREDHKGYRDRYEDRYEDMEKKYDSIDESYKVDYSYDNRDGLYDKNAIEKRARQYEQIDEKKYLQEDSKEQVSLPKATSFKRDVLSGIIFSEILGKPKSMQNKNI